MNPLEALWEYQQAELALAALNKEMKSTDANRKRLRIRRVFNELTESLVNMDKDLQAKLAKVQELTALYNKLARNYELEKDELESMEHDEECTAAEFTESRTNIEKLQGSISALAKELSAMVRSIDSTKTQINDVWAKAAKAKLDYNSAAAVCEAEKESFRPRIAEAKKLAEEKQADVPDVLLKKYEIIKRNHANPVAKLAGNSCGGCNVGLSSVVVRRVTTGNAIVECENCGRILISG